MSRTSRRRVLVVDNLADAADCLAMLLRLWGYDVQACYGGAEALEIARKYRPQVVLLDIGMPDMDGFEVSRRLRDQAALAGIVIIAISGYGNESERSRGRLAGFDHHLLKPVEPCLLQELLSRITSAADLATSETQAFPAIVSACFVSGNSPTRPVFSDKKCAGIPDLI